MATQDDSPRASDATIDSGHRGAGLLAGDLMAGRFRIESFAGAGGFAEVYRADDTRYHRHVALKIPFADLDRGGELWRLVNEVKAAQSVAHVNVMRAWEVGTCDSEGGDRHYIASEWIEGETLRTILDRSVGRLTQAEKLDIAHDLCAGLEAIHRQGLLHRDIKPENVMLTADGRGVITDFGLATLAGGATNPRAGTVGYKAQELEAGGEPSEQSDLYSLGVVLHELFTGSKPTEPPQLPDGAVPGEAFRSQLLRCLRRQPGRRPPDVRTLRESLPERPRRRKGAERFVPVETLLIDPEPSSSRTRSWRLAAAGFLGLFLTVALFSANPLLQRAIGGRPPAVLEYAARDLLKELGFEAEPEDRLQGYMPTTRPDGSASAAPAVVFWYRQSPRPIVTGRTGSVFRRVSDPPLSQPGELALQLDAEGRLLRFDAVPPAKEPASAGLAPEPDWRSLLLAAGLDPGRLRPTSPTLRPPRFADDRRAWQGDDPRREGESVRIEAAAAGSMPTFFRRVDPDGTPGEAPTLAQQASATHLLYWIFTGLVLLAAVALCLRNVRRGLADLKGATRLAVFIAGTRFLVWILGGHHTMALGQLEVLQAQLERGLHDGLRAWVLYAALEPHARKRWAWQVASWVRLLRGKFGDPLLGRDVLVGTLFGLGLTLCAQLYYWIPQRLGLPVPSIEAIAAMAGLFDDGAMARQCQALLGLRESVGMALYGLLHALGLSFLGTVGAVLVRKLLDRPVWSRTVTVLLYSILIFPSAGHPLADALLAVLITGLWMTALVRFGFLAATTSLVVTWWLNSHPLTFDLDAWYGPGASVPLVLLGALLVWGLRASLGSKDPRPAWVERLMDAESEREDMAIVQSSGD